MTPSEWQAVRRGWLKDNPPNHQGYYVCYLCEQWVSKDEVSIDHVEPRSGTSKEIVNSYDNLKPTHGICNYNKGSKRIRRPRRVRERNDNW